MICVPSTSQLLNTEGGGEADPPLIGSVFPQILVEDGGRQEGSSVVVFHLQVPQVRVGLPICTDNHLGDQQNRIAWFLDREVITMIILMINKYISTYACLSGHIFIFIFMVVRTLVLVMTSY